jgi:hypothetical protein
MYDHLPVAGLSRKINNTPTEIVNRWLLPGRPRKKPADLPFSIASSIDNICSFEWEVVMKIRPSFWRMIVVTKYSDELYFIDEFTNLLIFWRMRQFHQASSAHEAVTKAMAAVV